MASFYSNIQRGGTCGTRPAGINYIQGQKQVSQTFIPTANNCGASTQSQTCQNKIAEAVNQPMVFVNQNSQCGPTFSSNGLAGSGSSAGFLGGAQNNCGPKGYGFSNGGCGPQGSVGPVGYIGSYNSFGAYSNSGGTQNVVVSNGVPVAASTSCVPNIGDYLGNPNVTISNINQNSGADCGLRIVSGTYDNLVFNQINQLQSSTNGLTPPPTVMTTTGTQNFYQGHFMGIGNVFSLSGNTVFGVKGAGATGAAQPIPIFYISTPTYSRVITMSGIALAYIVYYPDGPFQGTPIVLNGPIGVLYEPTTYSTAQGYIQLVPDAPNGIYNLLPAPFGPTNVPKNLAMIVQFNLVYTLPPVPKC